MSYLKAHPDPNPDHVISVASRTHLQHPEAQDVPKSTTPDSAEIPSSTVSRGTQTNVSSSHENILVGSTSAHSHRGRIDQRFTAQSNHGAQSHSRGRNPQQRVKDGEILLDSFDRNQPMIIRRAATINTNEQNTSRASSVSEDDFDDIDPSRKPLSLGRASPLRQTSLSDPLSDVDEEIFPENISCYLELTFNNEKHEFCEKPYKHDNFVWYKLSSYRKLWDQSREVLERIQAAEPYKNPTGTFKDPRKLYLRYGSYYLRGASEDIRHSHDFSIDDEFALGQVAIRQICGFIRDYPFEKFDLVIHCDYSLVQDKDLNPAEQDPDKFLGDIEVQYWRKLKLPKQTICKRPYISRPDLKALTHKDIAFKIIDNARDLDSSQKSSLKKEMILRAAWTLQGVCVHASIRMSYLYHLLLEEPHKSKHYTDSNHPNLSDMCKDNDTCERYHEGFITTKNKFFAHVICFDRWFHRHESVDIVPVRFTDEKMTLGTGGSSKVYEVDIDPAHLGDEISTDPTRTYALKKFNTRPDDNQAFEREMRMLLYLAVYPHNHILTHITSWFREDTYFILYEQAKYNLRKHMEGKAGDMDNEQIRWFLLQFRGLADAVRHIHNYRVPNGSTIAEPFGRTSSRKRRGIIGRHHDIKPENILVFEKKGQLPIFKLSDFGSGKFSKVTGIVTGPQASGMRATQTYAGPESHPKFQFGNRMSRPFDMWSLGCVFLELLIWVADMQNSPDGVNKKSFADLREEANGPSSSSMDTFWSMNSMGQTSLNSAVRKVINHLKTQFERVTMRALSDLLDLVEGLLAIPPIERLTAVDLYNKIDAIVTQMEVDLDQEPDLYVNRFHNLKNPGDLREVKPLQEKWAQHQGLSADVSSVGVPSRRQSFSDLRNQEVGRDGDNVNAMLPSLPQDFVSAVGLDVQAPEGLNDHLGVENADAGASDGPVDIVYDRVQAAESDPWSPPL